MQLRCRTKDCEHCGSSECSYVVKFKISDDPAQLVAPPYRQQTSTQWRDNAAVLPRFDGVYRHNEETSTFYGSTTTADNCLFFANHGEVFDVRLKREGLGWRDDFRVSARSVRDELRRLPATRHGLYQVNGADILCSLTGFNLAQYEYSGTLAATAAATCCASPRTRASGRRTTSASAVSGR